MMYALRHDVVALEGEVPGPGNARLRDGKRPRPLVLRANAGDCLHITFENWLNPARRRAPREGNPAYRVARGPGGGEESDTPATRDASIHVNGLQYLDIEADGAHVGNNPSSLVAPGEQTTYRLYAEEEGTFFLRSMGAQVGGEGLGAMTALGLFGAVHVQPRGAKWYRSQVTAEQLEGAIKRGPAGELERNPDGTPKIDYGARGEGGRPILEMLDENHQIVHSDLTAIITDYEIGEKSPVNVDEGAFREFTVIFHDQIKVVQAFEALEHHTYHGIADMAGINYGASGAGAMVLANRAGIGPNADCANCKFEEFFMSSWANGDPALNVVVDESGRATEALWPDDPSNVYHSYLRDPVRFRNLHAGPRETHVFHLHGQQWLRSPDNPKSTYTDSQTIGPGEGFTYDIAYGGSGNRNLAPGDSIFHCHLYPHFAGGMWGLWRRWGSYGERGAGPVDGQGSPAHRWAHGPWSPDDSAGVLGRSFSR